MEGLAFVKDCAPGTFWEDSFKTCRLPEVIPVLPQRPMMSIFDTRPQMTVQPAYNGYAQETRPMMVPTTTMAPRYNGYQQTRPTLTFTTTTTTPMTTTTMAPKYNGYAQVTRPMMPTFEQTKPMMPTFEQTRPMFPTFEKTRPMIPTRPAY